MTSDPITVTSEPFTCRMAGIPPITFKPLPMEEFAKKVTIYNNFFTENKADPKPVFTLIPPVTECV